ncbi:ATP-binding cassette sub-family C member 11-like isoform X2 [Ochlerotatus camptorhynchus]|uniref:ATP-binding cassette sub-family C member 11-like isoform X2 n=1 Tax=Ochlerotatus camptorhynchus TaxID=644619 RepID=UPI0031D5A0C1
MREKLLAESQISLASTENNEAYGWIKSESTCSLSEAETSISDPKKVKRRVRNNVRSTRVNSAYTPHNRLSRYKTALNSIIPFRTSNTGSTDLPVDNVGCMSNSSFSWVRKFLITPAQQRTYQSLPTNAANSNQNDAFLLPKRPFSDSCEVNCRRLLGIYKYEETMNGRKKVSMFKVVWRFTRTRLLIASMFQCFAMLLEFMGVVIFSNLITESMQTVVTRGCQSCPAISNCSNVPPMILGIKFGMNWGVCNSTTKVTASDGRTDRLLLSMGVFLVFFMAMFFNSVKNWLNLRTAIRLRTAILSSVYKRAVKSNIVNQVSAHQIMTMANGESEAVFQIVESGVQMIGIIFGFVLAFVSGLILLSISGILPLVGSLPLLLLLIVTGNISKTYYRKFLAFGSMKLSVVEDILLNFKNVKSLQLDTILIDRFIDCLSRQYRALKWCIIYSTKFTGGVTSAILVGGLYLIWCDVNIKTESTEVLILLLVFAYHVQKITLDFCHCIHHILQGKASLEKVKQSYQLSTPDNVRLKPNRENLVIQINDLEAAWPSVDGKSNGFKLCLDSFEIVNGQIIGVTGNSATGKTTLLHTILRNTEVKKGKVLQRGKMAFFPSEPVLVNTSLKENVLFGEPMDPQRYYFAIHAMKLNEDILQAAGTDDIPITYLELTAQQLERIVLARAIYCHRQIIVLDEPLTCFTNLREAKELFVQMINTFKQENKTIILATRFDDFLQHCDRVFRIEDGSIYREGSYAEILNMPSHVEMTRRCNIETISRSAFEAYEGSASTAIYIAKTENSKANRRSKTFGNTSSTANGSTASFEQLKDMSLATSIRSFDVCDYITLAILHLINNVLYFGPIFILVIIVEQGDIHPWLSTICLAVIICAFLVDIFSKVHVARVTAARNKSYQQSLIRTVLKCSLSHLLITSTSDLVDLFTDKISARFALINSCIQYAWIVVFSSTLLVIANFWTVPIVLLLLLMAIVLITYLKYSMQHLYNHEHHSKRRMFSILSNHLSGRAAIQSFDYVTTFVQDFYNNVEENSTAIFMHKSIQYFAAFWLNFAAYFLGLPALLLILLLTPQSELSIHRYVLAMFSYLTLIHGIQKFVESTLATTTAIRKIDVLRNNIQELQIIEETPRPTSLTNSDIGVSVTFKDVIYRVANRKLLKISKLNIQAGETVAIFGTGSKLIIPLLCRVFSPNQGAVNLNQIDISQLSIVQVMEQVGVVPADPRAGGISVGTFLNPDGKLRSEQVNDVLIEVKLFESVAKLPNKIDDMIDSLTVADRQLLCLARCYLRKPALLLVEQIHPEIIDVVSMALKKKFAEQTVIVIASHEVQYKNICERLINLDSL